ncbi:MAG: hypothetical protein Q4G09_03080 [Clostridia bacterium]|nr:hypothetical protein [Clostridia bacterium]
MARAINNIAAAKEIGVAYTDKSNIPKVARILINSDTKAPRQINKDCLEKKPAFLIL